jgi:hypothetical protein
MIEGEIRRSDLGLIDFPRGPRPRLIRWQVNERGCHICISHCRRLKQGYPVISIAGKDVDIGRLLYMHTHGALPSAVVLRHQCDDPMCINPAHRVPGTKADNARDRDERQRTARGERGGNHQLTETQVREIRASTGMSAERTAAIYGVDKATVQLIWKGQTWRHLGAAPRRPLRIGNRKLIEAEVIEVLAHPEVSATEYARRLGVTITCICQLRHGRTWRHLSRRDNGGHS